MLPTTVWLMGTAAFARKLASAPAVTPVMMRVLGRLLVNAVNLIEELAREFFEERGDTAALELLMQLEEDCC